VLQVASGNQKNIVVIKNVKKIHCSWFLKWLRAFRNRQ